MIIVTVARKPLSAPNVASNVLEHGTGALNVDASRIAGVTKHNHANGVFRHSGGGVAQEQYVMQNYTATFTSTAGRWPANLILEHKPGCVRVGDTKVKGSPPTPSGMDRYNAANAAQGYRPGTYQKGAVAPPPSRLDDDGTEVVAVWDCEVGCPIAGLDEQSGMLKSGNLLPGHKQGRGTQVEDGGYAAGGGVILQAYGGDAGGASRYFKQVGGKG